MFKLYIGLHALTQLLQVREENRENKIEMAIIERIDKNPFVLGKKCKRQEIKN